MSNKPYAVIKSGASIGLQIALWKNDKGLSANISKRYNKDGEWKESKYLFGPDLAALAVMAPRALAVMDKYFAESKGQQSKPAQETEPEQQDFDDSEIPF